MQLVFVPAHWLFGSPWCLSVRYRSCVLHLGGLQIPLLFLGAVTNHCWPSESALQVRPFKKKGIKCHEFQAVDSCRAMLRVACLHFDKEWGLFVVSSAV